MKFGPMADAKKVNFKEVEGRSSNSRESPQRNTPPSKIPGLTSIFFPWLLTGNKRNSPFDSLPRRVGQDSDSAESLESPVRCRYLTAIKWESSINEVKRSNLFLAGGDELFGELKSEILKGSARDLDAIQQLKESSWESFISGRVN